MVATITIAVIGYLAADFLSSLTTLELQEIATAVRALTRSIHE